MKFQKILASDIHRPSAKPRRASYALSYAQRGSVDTHCSGGKYFLERPYFSTVLLFLVISVSSQQASDVIVKLC
ncbi:hypothetical protein Y032_0015g2870 [Ancylostoma ceylanicum]|uniref:Uncharacterized protein n=1 Tax=Ancylostoma ceylanicum TaxID=53326 RepID=A0A016V8S7_9BILA|nr:hypothetical protein Y032_0015g2870 [Ancylostoma ceylanicum]